MKSRNQNKIFSFKLSNKVNKLNMRVKKRKEKVLFPLSSLSVSQRMTKSKGWMIENRNIKMKRDRGKRSIKS